MAANFEVSPELRVLWQQYNILVDAIANYNPLEVALEARSRGVLPRDWIGLTGGTPVQKTTVLLSALSDRVRESSLVFYQLVELLKAHPPLSQLAILMEQRCREEVCASNLAAATQQKYLQLQQQVQQLQQQQLALQQHWSQLTHGSQQFPITSSLPLQGSNLQPQHSLDSHSTLVSGYPPGISTGDSDTSMVPGPVGMYMSQPHCAVPAASSLLLQGSNLQPQHSLSSHSTLAPGYPPGSSTSNIDTSVPGPGVPTASRLPLQGSNLQPQHSLGSHSSQASPDITTTSIDTTTVPQPSGQNVLTLNELYGVLNELHVVKAKWHDLGGSLKVKEFILAAIRVEFRDIPNDCLREMLSHWLKQVNPRPCWSAIVASLRMSIVDEPQLAQTLEAKYCPDISVLEERPPPQKIPRISSGNPVLEEERSPGPPQKTPRISSGPQPSSSVALLSQKHESVSTEFLSCCENIKFCYSEKAEAHSEHFPPIKQAKFINLAILDRGQLDQDSICTIQRSADDLFEKKKEIGFNDLFCSAEDGARILVEGRPGCGKTTLMIKVSREWAQGKVLKSIALLLLVPLRRFHNKENLEIMDILKFYGFGSFAEKVNNEIALCGGQNICILLDGIDEYPYRQSEGGLILGLMERRFLTKSLVFATSRPASSHFLRGLATKRAEILGFLRHQIKQYIKEYYVSQDDKSTALSAYLERYPNIKHMCYLPLHLAIIVYLNETLQQSMPKTETDVYLKFTNSILFRDMQKDADPNTPSRLGSPEELPTERLSAFRKICKLAYIASVESQQIFSEEDLMKVFGNEGMQFRFLGIVISDKEGISSGLEETYSFAHLTLQEFLAAYHLMKCSDTEQVQVVENYGEMKNMTVVWKFYCGLTQLKSDASVQVFKIMNEQVESCVMLDLIHCVHEALNSSCCNELVASRNGSVIIKDETLTPSDIIALAYCIQNAFNVLSVIKLCSCRWDDEQIDLLSSHVTVNPNIKRLCFEHTPVRKKAIPLFVGLLEKFPSVETLVLSKCISRLQSAEELLRCITAYRTLRHLNIDVTVAKSMGIDGLFSAIQSLEELRLSGSLVALEVLKEQERVKLISLKGKKENVLFFAARQSVTKVSLFRHKLLEIDWAVISELLKYCPRVETISLTESTMGESSLQELGNALKNCAEVRELILSGNKIGPDGAKSLCLGLKHCTSLRTLNLEVNSIGESGGAALGEALKNCPKLHYVNLGYNNLGPDGAKSLCLGLKPCTSLQTLHLWGNDMTDDAVDSLMELLKTLKDLKTLDLNGNRFTESGKTIIRQAAEDWKEQSNFSVVSLYV